MANQETQKLDNIIASRRAMLLGGGAALAALAMPSTAKAATTVSSYTDFDILNFALNLEYLEANFYYLAAFGTTINVANANSTAAGAAVIPTGAAGATGGTTAVFNTGGTAGGLVPFTLAPVKSYAIETAIEEGKHVLFLQNAIKSFGGTAVAQPAMDISPSVFNALAGLAGVGAPFVIGGTFNPYVNDFNFLAGAYIFEDVGVTAYHGAAPLISTGSTGKSILSAAASILAVEAYHSGLVRSTIFNADPQNAGGYLTGTQKISILRANVAHATNVGPTSNPTSGGGTYATVDDYGIYPGTYPLAGTTQPPSTGTVTLAGATGFAASNIADADPTYVIAYSRTTTQVLNIVTGGGAGTVGVKATGGFFPSGLNGTFS